MEYTYALVNSLTGDRLQEVTAAVVEARWSTRANSAASGSVTLQLRGTGLLERSDWRSFTEHWSRALVVSWGDVAVFAGLVQSRTWDAPTGRLTLGLVELNHMATWRMITGVSNYDPAGKLTVTNKSRRGMVRALYQAGLNRGDSSFYWNFPLDLGPDYAGGFSKTFHHYSLQSVDALVREWRDAAGGPDVHLDPEWRSGRLWWVLRTGAPRLSGATFEVSQSSPDSPVIGPVLVENGSKMTTGTFVAANGADEDMIVGLGDPSDSSMSLPIGTPYRDQVIQHKHVEKQAEADALGLADVEAHFFATRQKTFSLRITADVHPGNLRLGSRVRVWTDGDEFELEGWFDGYLVGLNGSTDLVMGLEVVPL